MDEDEALAALPWLPDVSIAGDKKCSGHKKGIQ